jgi:hypothetical protein
MFSRRRSLPSIILFCFPARLSQISLKPTFYLHLQVLYLSRNNLKTLDNIQQFTNLRAFSVADNLLPSFSSVAPLQELTALEAVSLEGNPLTDLPNYRHRMILMLQNSPLNQLDGKPVSVEDKNFAATVCSIEDIVVDLAVNTTCLINSFNRAHQVCTMHSEMYSKLSQQEFRAGEGTHHRQKNIARLVSIFEEERLARANNKEAEENDEDINSEKQEIEVMIIADAVAWHEKALKSGAVKPSSSAASTGWHVAFCRILADQAAKLEELVRSTVDSSSNFSTTETTSAITTVFVSLRQALQQLSQLRPGNDQNAVEQAEELRKRVIELHRTLVQELYNSSKDEGFEEQEGQNLQSTWLIPSTAGAGALRPLLSLPPSPATVTKGKSTTLDMTTIAAQHILATESVAKLERSLKEAETEAGALNHALATTTQKVEFVQAENRLLRQEQEAVKEANVALQHWLENANNETEAAKNQIESLTVNLSAFHEMHAAHVTNLETQIESLQNQLEDTESLLRADAEAHENAVYTLEHEVEVLQQQKHRCEQQLEAALHAAEVAAQQMQPVTLQINVFLAHELELERARNSELAVEVQKRQEEVAEIKAALDFMLALQNEQAAAAEEVLQANLARKSDLERLEECGLTLQARRVAKFGFAQWRRAARRSKKLDALELQKQQRIRFHVFSNWNRYTKSAMFLRTLNTAAVASAKFAIMQKMFAAWRSTSAHLKYEILSELSENDPRVHLAAEILQQKYLKSPFHAWRDRTHAEITNNEALVVFSRAQRECGTLKEAFAVWRETTGVHREESNELSCGVAARKVVFSRQVLRAWQRATRRATAVAIAEAAATRTTNRSLLAKTLAAWVNVRNKSVEDALIMQNMEECEALEAQQREIALRAAEEKAENRAHLGLLVLQRHVFTTWRTEVAYTKHIDAISTWCASSARRHLLLKSLGSWRRVVFSDQVQELAHEKGQIEASLRAATSEMASKEQEIEELIVTRLQALSRVEELEEIVVDLEDRLDAAAREAALLAERAQQAEDARLAAEEFEQQAILGAESAVAEEQQARRDAEIACQQAHAEREKARKSALLSQSEAAAALEACRLAEQRAQAAEESRVDAEIVAIDALESVEAASAACERLVEEATGLHIALNEANQRYTSLQEQFTVTTETINTLKSAEERYVEEQTALKKQLKTVQQRWKDAEEAKEIAESDAHVAMRQSQRLAEILEQHVQHQEHPLALIYK